MLLPQQGNKTDRPVLLALVACFAVHICLMSVGFHNTISDSYEFRQTQTALTVYYFLKDGLSLSYKTPLLGYPWMMPFEFPVYQWLTALLQMATGWQIITCGRLVSILFFYLCFVPVCSILNLLQFSRWQMCIVMMFVLVNPVLLFWSRTFMIESTVLFFSLSFLAFFIAFVTGFRQQYTVHYLFMMGAVITGALSAMVKITTFLTFLMVATLFVIHAVYTIPPKDKKQKIRLLSFAAGVLLICLLPGIGWTKYADHLKSLSYLGNLTASYNINHLNFGPLNLRWSPAVWKVLFARSSYALPISVVIIILSLLFPLRYRTYILLFSVPAVLTPLIITRLYFDHDYYTYANTILYSISAALFALSVWQLKPQKYRLPLRAFACFAALTAVFIYFHRYLPMQRTNYTDMYKIGEKIKAATRPGDVLLVNGFDWSSAIPYYAERKVVCLAPDWEVNPDYNNRIKDLPSFLQLFSQSHISAFVVWSDSGRLTDFDRKIAAYYQLPQQPVILKEGEQVCFLFAR